MIELAEDELKNFGKVWTSVFVSLCYIYLLSKTTKPGTIRLLSFLPVVFLFFLLPLSLTSVHFTGTTSFFITWLGSFKLVLFAFGHGPLSTSTDSFPKFIAIACFPIKQQQQNGQPSTSNPQSSRHYYIIKLILLLLILKIYDFQHRINPTLIYLVYFLHIYFMLDIILATIAATSKHILGLELDPQFNNPFLSTSLQDFWGKRWNLMVSSILRPTIYQPVLNLLNPRIISDRMIARIPATIATFAVSGIMHELIFYYMGRMRPDFVVTSFFLLHGFCLCAEILVKHWVSRSTRIPRAVSGPLTVVFVVATGFWLFLPPMLRFGADVRSFREYAVVGALLTKLRPSFI